MTEDSCSFDAARTRLEEIASQVRKKDTSLEHSLDLLEEGVRLANLCTEQIDQTQWRAAGPDTEPDPEEAPEGLDAEPQVAASEPTSEGEVGHDPGDAAPTQQ
jgi:exodeoxyribonuclease VII small subunit